MGHAEVINNGTDGVRSEFFNSLSLSLSLSIYIYIYTERERERERENPGNGYYESAACMDALTLFVIERECESENSSVVSGYRCRLLRLSRERERERERELVSE